MSSRGQVRALRTRAKSVSTGIEAESGVMRVARSGLASRIEGDPLDEVLAAVAASPSDAYWARRLIDLVRDPMTAWRYRADVCTAVCAWAQHDVSFFVHERYLSEQLAIWAWPREIFVELEATLRLDEPSLTHLVMGRLWLEARRTTDDLPLFYGHAARHLRKVEPAFRVGTWAESIGEALGVADPKELGRRAKEILAAAAPDARERTLLAILRGAARAGDWKLYDAHRRAYTSADVDGNLRTSSELVDLDSLRAEHSLVDRYTPPAFDDEEPVTKVTTVKQFRAMAFGAMTARPPSRTR